jgi:hypothetical protein
MRMQPQDGSGSDQVPEQLKLAPPHFCFEESRNSRPARSDSLSLADHAVAFVGDAGAGKSTTAAALARRGHSLLSDDVVVLHERDEACFVQPGYRYLCLRPQSAAMLYGPGKSLPAVSPNYDKCELTLIQNSLKF